MEVCATCGTCFDPGPSTCSADGGRLTTVFPGSRVLGGRYQLDQRIAAGAMGVVFRATHIEVRSTVAVKVMIHEREEMRVSIARFRREAQILGQIKHPNAVLVMDFGIEDRGAEPVPYLVTEYLRGEGLDRVLHLRAGGRMTVAEVERIVTPLSEAVAEAHHLGIVHRDIKPSNVFLERLRDGSEIVKVLDFGIAKLIEGPDAAPAVRSRDDETTRSDRGGVTGDDAPTLREELELPPTAPAAQAELTRAGGIVGTMTYMAPEQIQSGPLSPATDVYAVATLIFRMLAGHLPFTGDDLHIVVAKMQGQRPSVREAGADVPPELDLLLQTAFSGEPSERPDLRELAAGVRRAASVAAKTAGPVGARMLPLQLGALTLAVDGLLDVLRRGTSTRSPIEHYGTLRDRLLALDTPLTAVRVGLSHWDGAIGTAEARELLAAARTIERGATSLPRVLAGAAEGGRVPAEYLDYLTALGTRLGRTLLGVSKQILSKLDEAEAPEAPPAAFDPFEAPAEQSGSPRRSFEELAAALASKEPLESSEALEHILDERRDELQAALARATAGTDPLCEPLFAGLWLHADELVLRELYPGTAKVQRLLPHLARATAVEAAKPFAALAKIFRAESQLGPGEDLDAMLASWPEAARRTILRCLLVGSNERLRGVALGRLRPAELWTAISYPRTPIALVRSIFEKVLREDVPGEYLKVFFMCVRPTLRELSRAEDLAESLRLLSAWFTVPCFHEDLVFEPLLELEAEIRGRARSVGVDASTAGGYDEQLERFRKKGSIQSMPLESMRDIPLPIQRKLARQGLFLSAFACHVNERIACETLPHLMAREDVVVFLKLPKIHRSVIGALAREPRFFTKEEPKLALLSNPKTPAHAARKYLPFVSRFSLKTLVANKNASAEIRQLASKYLARTGEQ